MSGPSYMGIDQIFAAATHQPGLKAIFPQVPAADVYGDVVASGGSGSPFIEGTAKAPTMRAMLKRTLLSAALLAAGTTLAACGSDSGSDSSAAGGGATASSSPPSGACTYSPDGSSSDVKLPPSDPSKTGKVPVTISSTVGDLKLTLNADKTPCTVNSFVSLAEQGFFEGIYCHRIGDPAQFPMLQCGDPTAKDPANLASAGRGGPGYVFADELTGSETYGAGTLAMANSGPDTNGSQFFMVFGDIGLSPDYTVFGTIAPETISRLKAVAAKGNAGTNPDGTGAPNTPVKFTKVTVG